MTLGVVLDVLPGLRGLGALQTLPELAMVLYNGVNLVITINIAAVTRQFSVFTIKSNDCIVVVSKHHFNQYCNIFLQSC